MMLGRPQVNEFLGEQQRLQHHEEFSVGGQYPKSILRNFPRGKTVFLCASCLLFQYNKVAKPVVFNKIFSTVEFDDIKEIQCNFSTIARDLRF